MANKKCEKCGYELGCGMKFCPVCGTSVPVSSNTESSSSTQAQEQPRLFSDITLYPRPQSDNERENQKKKGLKAWVITLIVCATVFTIALTSIFTILFIGDIDIDDISTSRQNYEFTTGYIENGYYINKWANIKFPIDNIQTNNKPNILEAFKYDNVGKEGLLFGHVSLDMTKKNYDFILAFEYVGSNYNEKEYIKLMTDRLESLYEIDLDASYSTQYFGNSKYLVAKLSLIRSTKYLCVRIQEDYAICFITDSSSYIELSKIKEVY